MKKDEIFENVVNTSIRITNENNGIELNRDIIFSSHQEEYCDTKCTIFKILSMLGYSNNQIGRLAGLSREAIGQNLIKHSSRLNFRFMMSRNEEQIKKELNINYK